MVTCFLDEPHSAVQRYLVWSALMVMREGGTRLRFMRHPEGTELRCWMPEGESEMIPPPGRVIDELARVCEAPGESAAVDRQTGAFKGVFQVILEDNMLTLDYRGLRHSQSIVVDFELPTMSEQRGEAAAIFQGFRRFASKTAEEGSDAELIREINEHIMEALCRYEGGD